MPTATQPNTTPTRRSALGFSAAAIVAGLATPVLAKGVRDVQTPDADAELLALCAAFFEAHAAWYARTDEFSDAWEAAGDRRHAISDRLAPITPRTDAGHTAKAAVAFALVHEEEPDLDRMSHVQLFVYSTLRDIAGGARA